MGFWNFVHYNLGMHVYDFLTILTAAIMAVVGVTHGIAQRKREKENEKNLPGNREE